MSAESRSAAVRPKRYTGRFAPSPTGPLHAGSLVAALASWLDARAWNQGQGGRWLVRIEDLDTQRCHHQAIPTILRQLQDCGLVSDEVPLLQSTRLALYRDALKGLVDAGQAYPCGCSRRDIASALAQGGQLPLRHAAPVYPGTCRTGLQGKPALAWRLRVAALERGAAVGDAPTPVGLLQNDLFAFDDRAQAGTVHWNDRRLGPQSQDVSHAVGDFVLKRADGPFAYQLAVVVDDAAQQVSHVVRGEDLADNTARQILLQRALGLTRPQYLHAPLVLAYSGEKLSKQTGAPALNTARPLEVLNAAAITLGLSRHAGPPAHALGDWVAQWRALYNPTL
ncbi:MAG: tRNA glutamyl-Q(34) synthetase GluQRS [Burkholderiaceae bacterium]